MKKLYTFIVASLLCMSTFAQSPEMMSYQAVVRDAADNLVASSPVGMQISILQGSTSGTASYVETHTPTSNQNGLVSIEIGNGTSVSGDFSTIDWANGPYFIKTETDPTGGTSYTITGISQLLSVPYALYAKNTAAWQTNNDTTYTLNTVGVGVNSPAANFHLQNGGFSDLLIESTGSVEDASVWLKNPSKTWRLHGDQNDDNKFKIGLWTDYSEIGGLVDLQYAMTIDTLGNVGIGTATPQSKLHIDNGFLSFTGAGSTQGIVSNIAPFGTLKFYCGPYTGNASNGYFFRESTVLGDVTSYNDLVRIAPHSTDVVRVGIGIMGAQRNLHVKDVMRLEPRATVPSSAAEGDIYMDSTTHKLMVYDGTIWQACW